VVEEKRHCPNCYNTADEVVREAEEADREHIDSGEIVRMDAAHASFECSLSYLKHLDDKASHNALLKNMTSYLWKKKKNDEAVRQMAMLAPMWQWQQTLLT
jgi:putative aminopeptidase FrvX